MDWQHEYASKIVDAQEAVSKIKRGSRVFIGTGCGEPQHLIRAMVEEQQLQDIIYPSVFIKAFFYQPIHAQGSL